MLLPHKKYDLGSNPNGPIFKEQKMELDQIIKLIKLANSNPNQNEANSAARSVCKALDNYDFTHTRDFDYVKWCLRHHCPKTVCKCG